MKKSIAVIIVALAFIVGIAITYGIASVTYKNAEVRQRNLIVAKVADNPSQFDNMKKKISQCVQVTDLQKSALVDVIVGNAKARNGGSGTLATLVKEAVPNLDTASQTYRDLMNVITGSRDSWTMRQTELNDMKRVHDNMIDTFPSSWFVGDRKKIEVTIVTSGSTKESFRTGEDNETKLN